MRTLSIFLIIWQFIVVVLNVPNYIIPSPIAIMLEAKENWQLLLEHSIYTLFEALTGLFIAIVLAYIIAIIVDLKPQIRKLVMRVFAITQTIPIIIIAPIFLIWFGFGLSSKILLVISICLFPLVVNILSGFEQVSNEYAELFYVMQAKKGDYYRRLKIPGSRVNFFSGLQVAITYSISGAVAAEYVGSNKGLGIYMARSLTNYNYEMIFAITIIVVVMTLVLLKIMNRVKDKILKGRRYV